MKHLKTKTLLFTLISALNFSSAQSAYAYPYWVVIAPFEVCGSDGVYQFQTMVNTGAGFMEFHRFRREFISCSIEDGKVIVDMNLYHRSNNSIEAGMVLKRGIALPEELCGDLQPQFIRFNSNPNPKVLANGKSRGQLRMLEIKTQCSKR